MMIDAWLLTITCDSAPTFENEVRHTQLDITFPHISTRTLKIIPMPVDKYINPRLINMYH